MRIDLPRGPQQLDAVHARHHQVGEQEVAFRALQLRQRGSGVGEADRIVILGGQRVAQRPHLRSLVVNHQDAGL
ncbi:hypothetical protein ABIF52_001602 [Bradyrhizobium japonicum]